MILYTEKLNDVTRKTLELIKQYSRAKGCKINTQKSLAFLYTNKDKSETEIKGTIPFTNAAKIIKYLAINLPKETNPKGNQPWIFVGRTDAEDEAPKVWPPDAKSQLVGENPDTGKD